MAAAEKDAAMKLLESSNIVTITHENGTSTTRITDPALKDLIAMNIQPLKEERTMSPEAIMEEFQSAADVVYQSIHHSLFCGWQVSIVPDEPLAYRVEHDNRCIILSEALVHKSKSERLNALHSVLGSIVLFEIEQVTTPDARYQSLTMVGV
jgi:hypothetical protein